MNDSQGERKLEERRCDDEVICPGREGDEKRGGYFHCCPPHRLSPQSRLQALDGFIPLLLVFLLQS